MQHTKSATKQLHPHCDVTVPGLGINTYVAGFDGRAKPVHHDEVTFSVSLEKLKQSSRSFIQKDEK